jgi:tryptophanyl-tRNA synthetase
MNPDDCNVFALLKLFVSGDELDRIASYYAAGKRDGEPFGYGHAKQMLAARIEAEFAAGNERRQQLLAAPQEVEDVLARSAERARGVARATIERCKRATGLS